MVNKAFGNIVQTINLCLSIAIVVFIVRIYNETKKDKNPIEQYEHEHYSTNRFLFYSSESLSLKNDDQINKYCQCVDKFLNKICTEEQIISGCYDIIPNEQNNLLRKLANKICGEVEAELNKNKKLSEIFILNYSSVSKMALGILIIYCCILGVIAIIFFSLIGACFCGEGALCLFVACAPCIYIIVICSGLADLVLFIIMLVKFYKGRTTGEFIEFYNDCSFTNKDEYLGVYNNLKKIRAYMTTFIVLNSIGIFFNYLGVILDKISSHDEEEWKYVGLNEFIYLNNSFNRIN